MSESPGQQGYQEEDYEFTSNKKGFGYAIAAILYEVLVCLVYGLLFGYSDLLAAYEDVGNLFLVSALTILAIVGTAFLTKDSASSMPTSPMPALAESPSLSSSSH